MFIVYLSVVKRQYRMGQSIMDYFLQPPRHHLWAGGAGAVSEKMKKNPLGGHLSDVVNVATEMGGLSVALEMADHQIITLSSAHNRTISKFSRTSAIPKKWFPM
jgi:hypothetical protein